MKEATDTVAVTAGAAAFISSHASSVINLRGFKLPGKKIPMALHKNTWVLHHMCAYVTL